VEQALMRKFPFCHPGYIFRAKFYESQLISALVHILWGLTFHCGLLWRGRRFFLDSGVAGNEFHEKEQTSPDELYVATDGNRQMKKGLLAPSASGDRGVSQNKE
jgi:hypothetical protein